MKGNEMKKETAVGSNRGGSWDAKEVKQEGKEEYQDESKGKSESLHMQDEEKKG